MTHMSLQDVSNGSLRRLLDIARQQDWGEISYDVRDELGHRQVREERS